MRRRALVAAVSLVALWAAPSAQAASGQITGKLTSAASGAALAGATVSVYDDAGNSLGGVSTAPDGTYPFGGLATGTYEVSFAAGSSGADVVPQFYNGRATIQTADPVAVMDTQTTANIDAALQPGGHITGTVKDAAGAPLGGVVVLLYDSGRDLLANTATAPDGTYVLSALATGSYEVGFIGVDGLTRYYNGRSTVAAADPVAVTAGATTSGIDATLPAGGQITGAVQDATGQPVAGILVTLYGSDGRFLLNTSTGDDGSYALTGLETGTYVVGFSDANGDLADQYYNDKTAIVDADPVSVVVGQTTPGIDAALRAAGHIAGTVTDATGTPLAGIDVDLYGASGDFIDNTATAADGSYSLAAPDPARQYKVGFDTGASGSNVAPQFYNAKATLAGADPIAVAPGATTPNIDASLLPGGAIAGRAFDAGGAALADVVVELFDAAGAQRESTTTAADGSYSFVGLASGTYAVGFFDVTGGGHLAQYYNDRASLEAADPVAVTAGATAANIDAHMPLAGRITGSVTDTGGAALQGVFVTVYDATGKTAGFAQSNSDGIYSVGSLQPGAYRVGFDPSFGNPHFVAQFYNGKSTLAAADAVAVTLGTTTSGIDAHLAVGAQISGTVKDTAGNPLPNAEVVLYRAGSTVTNTFAAQDGSYAFTGLAAGTYRVGFSGPGIPPTFIPDRVPQFYNGKPSLALADPITVAAGGTAGGIDAALALGGTIAGKVTDSAGAPIPGASVIVRNAGGSQVAGMTTAPLGTYAISGLAPGAYEVSFAASGFVTEYYIDKPSIASANPVDVVAGTTTSGIDAVLASAAPPAAAGAIAGRVTDSSGRPLADVQVTVYDDSGFVDNASTVADGTYAVTDLPVGSYAVGFDAGTNQPRHNYVPQFYNGKPDLASADPVTVSAGATTQNIDASLQTGGQITGRVTDTEGRVLVGIAVDLYDSSRRLIDTTSTRSVGDYRFSGLATGTYYVGFRCCADEGDLAPRAVSANPLDALPQFYNGKSTLAAADPIAVTAGASTPNIDAVLQDGGQVTGTVTDPAGNPLADVEVDLYDSGGGLLDSTTTGSAGSYRFTALPTGSYRVGFVDTSGAFATQFYNGKPDLGSADPVAVTAPAVTSGIDAHLVTAGAIAGTVTDAAGAPLGFVDVTVYDAAGNPAVFTATGADGTYRASGLAAGTYRVGFTVFPGDGREVLPEFYNAKPDLVSADPVTVATGATTPGVDAHLQRGGRITGTVTDTATHPLAGVTVTVYLAADGSFVASAVTDPAGVYQVGGLPSGTYKVGFDTGPNGADYLPQFFADKPDLGNADPVAVTAGSDTPNIDAHLTAGGQIGGTVTDGAGHPLAGVAVTVYDVDNNPVGLIATDASGRYVETKLEGGQFRIGFALAGYADQFFDNEPDLGHADPVTVTAGSTATGIDAALVAQAVLPISTQVAPATVALGASFHDTATLGAPPGGAPAPTGNVSFSVYGPSDPTCAQTPVFSSSNPLNAAGTAATSDDFTPIAVGAYRVIAQYGGDPSYGASTSGCADVNEAVTVGPGLLTLATQVAPTSISLGGAFHDTATLGAAPAGAPIPTGTVRFDVYSSTTCSGAADFTSTNPLDAAGTTAVSGNFTPTVPGTYRLVASYSGDASYAAVASACADPTEAVTVGKASVTVATQVAPAAITLSAPFRDTATLGAPPAGAPAPTGTVRFDVFSSATCSGAPDFSSTNAVSGTTAVSGDFAPVAPGTYHVIATYGGDANYASTVTACADPAEAVTVSLPPAPAVTGLAPASGPEGGGTSITITGSNLGGATAVSFGTAFAPTFLVESPTRITATAPAGTGTVDVTVSAAGGTSATGPGDAYTYIPPPPGPPVVASISPSSGSTAGGTGVLISGSDLDGATSVHFGSAVASIVNVNAAGTRVTVLAPAGTGTVDVAVTTPVGTSATSSADRYTYVVPPLAPAVSGLSPATGDAGASVTITGTNLDGATAVSFGAVPATSFTVDGPTQITAIAPAGSGVVPITVTTPGGTSGTAATFTYVAAPGGGGGTTGGAVPPVRQPAVQTGAPKAIDSTTEEFTATINPQGLQTTMHFEYTAASGASANLSAITYAARTPEQVVGSDFADHTVTARVAGLVPNSDYHVRAVASNPGGTAASGDTAFTSATDSPPPPPVLGKSFNAEPVSGVVYVLLPGAGHVSQAHASAAKGVGFIPLTEARQLPVGTIFDATAGIAKLTTAGARPGTTQSGSFGSGLFKLLQNRKQKGLAELSLVLRASSLKKCSTASKSQAQTAAKKALPKTVLTLLRATAKGRFQTRGRYSSATVRGTSWTTSDRCDGTFTHVTRGVVVVNNTRRHRNIVLRAGKSYLAKKP